MSFVLAVVACALPTAGEGVFAGVVARDPQLDGLAERLAVSVGQALERQSFLDLGSPPLPDPEEAPDAVLKSALDDARARYLEGDFAGSLQRANDAATRFESAGAFRAGPGWQAYADALVLRSVCSRRLGRDADADESLRRLGTVAPKAKLDPDITPEKTAERWAELVAELWARPRVQIEVVTTPPGAQVVVDGKVAGHAPIVARELLPGVHFVGLLADGERRERRVTVSTGSARVEEQVGEPRSARASALRDAVASPVTSDALHAAATPLAADVVVGVLVPDAKGSLFVLARLHDGKAQVAGTRVQSKADAKARADDVVAALVDGKDGWLGDGPASPTVVLTEPRVAWAGGAGAAEVGTGGAPADEPGEPGDATVWIFAGVGAGALAVAAAAAITGVVLAAEAAKKLSVTVDASKL
ncbi:MAG: PEGA domain-containing protein [Deltaproteobacteria bacterium]|nr:PEGA domain-containing protein [Deltaproteobacteria bacterium]